MKNRHGAEQLLSAQQHPMIMRDFVRRHFKLSPSVSQLLLDTTNGHSMENTTTMHT